MKYSCVLNVALEVGIQRVDDQHAAIAEMLDILSACGDTEGGSETVSEVLTALGKTDSGTF